MEIKEALPIFERVLEELKALPEDIDIIGADINLFRSEQYARIHVNDAEDMRRLAPAYGRCIRRSTEGPNENGEAWVWLRFSAPDKFLRFVQCERIKAAPSDATAGDGRA